MTDFRKLVPEMDDWNNGKGVDIHGWIGAMGSYAHAVGYSTIFWPDFVEVAGCVFRSDVTRIEDWLTAYDGDRRTIEATANHVHIDGLHYGDDAGKTPERLRFLARVLSQIYACKLRHDFPEKTFRVEIGGHADSPVVTFFQEMNERAAPPLPPHSSPAAGSESGEA